MSSWATFTSSTSSSSSSSSRRNRSDSSISKRDLSPGRSDSVSLHDDHPMAHHSNGKVAIYADILRSGYYLITKMRPDLSDHKARLESNPGLSLQWESVGCMNASFVRHTAFIWLTQHTHEIDECTWTGGWWKAKDSRVLISRVSEVVMHASRCVPCNRDEYKHMSNTIIEGLNRKRPPHSSIRPVVMLSPINLSPPSPPPSPPSPPTPPPSPVSPPAPPPLPDSKAPCVVPVPIDV
jgi:hypothetical protein